MSISFVVRGLTASAFGVARAKRVPQQRKLARISGMLR
jgi:hypothetical protein